MKTLFYGGTILTMDRPMRPEALLIEDGRVLALGSRAELRQQAGVCEEVDLEGHTLIPGLIDPHSHFFQVACALLQVSLDGADSPAEMKRRIRAFIAEHHIRPGQWINARDYDNNILPGAGNPSFAEINDFAPDNPLVIHHKSGHMGLMNTPALREIGITAGTPSPEGGRIEVVNGELTGYMEENAFFNALKKVPMAGPEQLLEAFEEAQRLYASYGITTLQDGMVVKEMLPMYGLLLDKNLLTLDVMLYPDTPSYEAAKALLAAHPGNTHLHIGGLKAFLDGSPQGRTAWMRTPYLGGDGSYCGYGTMTDEAVTDCFRFAGKNGLQLICHCNGDAAAAQFLRCLEEAEKEYPLLKTLRPVIIHGQLMGRDQLPKAAELGAMVSFFVAHVYHWGDVHIRNFGRERADFISPARSALEAGVRITFHQDAPVIRPDMMETLWCAVNRITREGVTLGPSERLTPEEALRAVTVNAAYQYSLEDKIGSLAPGKAADLAVLDRDPLSVPPEELRSIRVLRTYKAGKEIYSL